MWFLALVATLGLSLAQRPSTASTCDYYAEQLYGTNTSDTQHKLIESIVSLAFGGGSTVPNVSTSLTGIFNPGSFQSLNVDLRPWFDGSLASTNLNNQGVGVDWLDGGGAAPLHEFLNGTTSSVILSNTTNQYELFTHFFSAFSHIFGCSLPQSSSSKSGQSTSLAYVHKYMNLNYTDLGHFIDQLTLSTQHFGFSDQDAQTFSTSLNSRYNVRCAPPLNGQLLSLCQASNCPLAEPSPDCNAYTDLTAEGTTSAGASSTPGPTVATTTYTLPTLGASTSATPTPSATSTQKASSSTLTAGPIAGIAIGGAAVLLFIIFLIFFFRRRSKKAHIEPFTPTPVYSSPSAPSYSNPHASYLSGSTVLSPYTGPTIAEMESPGHPPPMSPELEHRFRNNASPELEDSSFTGGTPEMRQASPGPHRLE
ncbi:hypothetical protein BP5796_04273 [Coleophoma crateriformis]|uniref:Uncharacterized protein n=1 Tax=Coleophoma crateriformis TaxID=565419 RepID=A0A3D8SJJ6_9HELO|nr:hypothetical protein BP5796_04273 [Coleophoma crateriformis]